jgi:hypothetical protein
MAEYKTSQLQQLTPGTRVEVRTRFVGSWSGAFEIAGVRDGEYRVRRLSDGAELPSPFQPEDIRPAG